MKRDRGTNNRDERSRGIEIHIADAFVMIRPPAPFKLAKHSSNETKVIRFLRQFISQDRGFTVDTQEKQPDKVVILTSCRVHCQRNEDNWVWLI